MSSTKIKLEDLTEKNFADARAVVKWVVDMQTAPADPVIGMRVLYAITKNTWAGWGELSEELQKGLYEGLKKGLNEGLWQELYEGLNKGLEEGLNKGLEEGLWRGLEKELNEGLWQGLEEGLWRGLNQGLWRGLNQGLQEGLGQGLEEGLNVGLKEGLSQVIVRPSKTKIEFCYGGTFWFYWLCRYLVSAQLGCKLDLKKLALLLAFCRYCPLIGETKDANGKTIPVVLPKPTKISWQVAGHALLLPP